MDPDIVRREWADRSGEYSPEYYAYYGPNETSEAIRKTLDQYLGPDPSILELGCSSGRHLAHLLEHGYTDLTGIEVNDDAFDVMRETYPELATRGTFHHDMIEAVIGDMTDGRFDAVFAVETLQHIHPESAWVFDELVRITDDLLITVENEGDRDGTDEHDVTYVSEDIPLYHRDWKRIFTDRGLVEVDAVVGERDTRRTFRIEE
ncbi:MULTISPECIES: class I SAM-dependent methyltransferase [unclassified Halorhabdus]|uniref:class I SAM-dependent methyltransferase n=1 Tax=unclassified Halorhabdus TaxID=2621901 RepID=UPI0023DB77B7|nr:MULTISPECIES: class I SAM-dependent methyltransferase [unclassified Halorhabdus]WEL17525.1 SAM-dependent methyltransferase [Halorhabdus sp. SVX81]WEL21405.1 SAM-dependent methyltransferase [Halorhabdus sp. BNX81]